VRWPLTPAPLALLVSCVTTIKHDLLHTAYLIFSSVGAFKAGLGRRTASGVLAVIGVLSASAAQALHRLRTFSAQALHRLCTGSAQALHRQHVSVVCNPDSSSTAKADSVQAVVTGPAAVAADMAQGQAAQPIRSQSDSQPICTPTLSSVGSGWAYEVTCTEDLPGPPWCGSHTLLAELK